MRQPTSLVSSPRLYSDMISESDFGRMGGYAVLVFLILQRASAMPSSSAVQADAAAIASVVIATLGEALEGPFVVLIFIGVLSYSLINLGITGISFSGTTGADSFALYSQTTC